MGKKKVGLKKDLGELVSQLQQQAGDGEIDASLIDQIAETVNAVDQDGDTQDTTETPEVAEKDAAPAATENPAPEPEEKEDEDEVQKVYGTRPPRPDFVVPGSAAEGMRAQLPGFIKALESGSIKKAQDLAGARDQSAFDVMFNMACKQVLTEGGFTYKNMAKLHASAPSGDEVLAKGMTASDLPGVYLMRLAKLMMPVYAGLRRRFPTQSPTAGSDKATWRSQIGFSNLNVANLLSVAEAAIGDEINESALTFETPFRDITLNDKVNLKAIAASRGYDDPLQVSVIRLMTALLQIEERKILGDNYAALATPAAPTAVGAGTGTIGTATAKFCVAALTYRGYVGGSTGTDSAIGETDASALSTGVDLSGKATVDVSWAAVPGAVAYNLFYNPSSTTKYFVGTYTATKVTLSTLPATGNAPCSTNKSANANGFEGLLNWCELSTIYSNAIPHKISPTDLGGAKLSTGSSGITEIDAKLAALWKNWQIAPTLLVMSPDMVGQVTDKLLALNSGSMYRIEISSERGTMQGGAFVSGYVNKFAPFADGTPRYVDIIPHPYMPDGTILFLCETIPYPMAREARGFALDTLIPYTYFPLAASTIAYPFAVTTSEVLECYHPAAQTALTGIGL
jgi:hypothetical protein